MTGDVPPKRAGGSIPSAGRAVDPRIFRGDTIANADELRRAAAGIRRDFFSHQPPDPSQGLLVPRTRVAYERGTTTPLRTEAFGRRDTGLLVPISVPGGPQPGDLIKAYTTSREVLGAELGQPLLNAIFMEHDLATTLIVAAQVLASLEARQLDPGRDLQIADVLVEPYRSRARAEVEQGRVLLTAQALLIAVKRALSLCRPRAKQGEEPAYWLVPAALEIQAWLGQQTPSSPVPVPGVQGDAGAVVDLLRTQIHAHGVNPVHLLAQAQQRWREIPAKFAGAGNYVDLEATLREVTGVRLDDLVAVGLRLWMLTQRGQLVVRLADIGLDIPKSRVEAVMRRLAAPPHVLRRRIADEEARHGGAWTFDALRWYPLVRLSNGRFVIVSTRFLLERVFSVIRFDVKEGLEAAGRGADAERAVGFWQRMCEQEAVDALAVFAPDSGALKRLYRETELQLAFRVGKKQTPSMADAAIEYPGAWVVVEATTSTLHRDVAAGGSVAALLADFSKLDAKARQIESTIDALRTGEGLLTKRPALALRRFVPVLVMAEGFPVNAATTTSLSAHLQTQGILAAPDVGPLHVLDAQDLAMAESLSATGVSFLELLSDHEQSAFRRMSLGDYILVERGVQPALPERMEGPYDRAWRPIFDAVRR
jgi:hypothetical protein